MRTPTPRSTLGRRPGPASRRGFTLIEMVIVLALLGLMLAFVLPRLTGSQTFAEEQRAQTSVSGALDTAVQLFLSAGERDGDGCNATVSAPRKQLDPGPGYAAVPANPPALEIPAVPANCPVFANPTALAGANGDVKFTTGDKPSTSSALASVAAIKTALGWRVAVAALAPQGGTGKSSVASCWIAWHQFPNADNGTSMERYFVVTKVTGDVATTDCTGNSALVYETAKYSGDTFCDNPGAGQSPLGLSWRRPCPDFK